MEIKEIGASPDLTHMRMLLYGDSGTGKTTLLMQARKVFDRIFVLNFDPQSNLTMIAAQHGIKSGVSFLQFDESVDSPGQRWDGFIDAMVRLHNRATPEHQPDLVIIENGGEFHKLCLNYSLALRTNRQASAGKTAVWTNPTKEDYGAAHARFYQNIRELHTMNCHTAVTFHQQIEKDEVTGVILGRLLIEGKNTPEKTPGMFNMHLHTSTQPGAIGAKPSYIVETVKQGLFQASDKSGALAPIEKADFPAMYLKIKTAMGWV